MKVLVSGATGFIGREIMRQLAVAGHDLVALTRDTRLAGVRLPVLAEIRPWNPVEGRIDPAALEGVDAVVHLAGEDVVAGRWSARRKQIILRSRVEGTRLLVAAMRQMDRPPGAFVVASAVGYYGGAGDTVLEEGAPPGSDFLARVSAENEQAANEAEALGVRTVAMRIGVVLGADGGALRFLLPLFKMGLGGPAGSGRQWMSWIHLKDLAALIVHAIERDALRGAVNAVAPAPVIHREFSRALARAVRRPALLPVPAVLLRMVLGERSGLLLVSHRVVPARALAAGFKFVHGDLAAALADIADEEGHEWTMEQWVPVPPEGAFSFCANTGNLETLAPPQIRFRLLRVSADPLADGTTLDYRLRLHGIAFHWQSEIYDWHPGIRFSDRQSRGPYTFWRHSHEFHEKNGGTVIRDRAHYKVPLGAPGDFLAHPLVRADLEKIFAYRRERIAQLLGGPS
jgi:uncharacterized protein (TIGR01777 family)